jgi:DNA repair exonuclease SbcCD ATPase subunit
MYFRINHQIVRNFLSYGNIETKLEFEPGLSLVHAKNGGGKSTLFLDAVSYNLYGKPYRDIKIGELANRKNGCKGLYTEGSYTIDKDTYRIIRTYAPARLEIYKNDDPKPLESASSKKLDQEEIEDLIGINYNIFKLVIAIATSSNPPFLSLGLPEKRKVMESIFSINIFGEMLAKARKSFNGKKTEKTIYQNNVNNLKSLLISLKNQITEIDNSIRDFDSTKAEEIESLKNKKKTITKDIKDLSEKLKELESLKIELDIADYVSEQIKIDSEIKFSENKIKENKTQIKFLEKNTECPLCKHELTKDHKKEELEKLEKTNVNLQKVIDKNKVKLSETLSKITKQKEIKKLFEETNSNVSMTNLKIKNLEKNRGDIEDQIKKVEERVFNLDSTNIKKDFDEKSVTFKEYANKLDDLNKDLKKLEMVIKMLSEEGIKSYFFKRLVPLLNAKINEQLNNFDLPVVINFNENMEESIDEIGSAEKGISYNSFSEGEKKRIDIAILLSFINTMKTISNWNCNLLVFDEILDSATDADGLEKLLGSIKEITLKDSNICSYVVSHRESMQDLYDRIIEIKKVNGFSKVEVKTNG